MNPRPEANSLKEACMGAAMAAGVNEESSDGEEDRGSGAEFEVVADWVRSSGQGEGVSVIVHNNTDAEVRFEWLVNCLHNKPLP